MDKTKKIFECVVSDIEGVEGSLHYYAIESEFSNEEFNSKVYGIRVENKFNGITKNYIEFIDVTSIYEEIINLIKLMAQNTVTPISVGDVVEDFVNRVV